MIIVVQCAGAKRRGAGFLKTKDGKKVLFVADPAIAPPSPGLVYARPDDAYDSRTSWREMLRQCNLAPGNNPLGLFCAGELYANPIYHQIVQEFGTEKIYILSAGWGLIPASFLTPNYDITFQSSAEPYKRRQQGATYLDFHMLSDSPAARIFFFGGKDYVPLFCELTASVRGKRTVFYKSRVAPVAPGCSLERFQTTRCTNWHYECLNAVIAGKLALQ